MPPLRPNVKSMAPLRMERIRTSVKNIQLELVKLNTPYTFTFNLCDKYQFWGKDNRIDLQQETVRFTLDWMHSQWDVVSTMHLECSSTGRLHWHGTLKYTTEQGLLKFYLKGVHSLMQMAVFEIDTISEPELWATYCTKQTKYFKKYTLVSTKYDPRISSRISEKCPLGRKLSDYAFANQGPPKAYKKDLTLVVNDNTRRLVTDVDSEDLSEGTEYYQSD